MNSAPSHKPNQSSLLTPLLRWTARITSLASLAVMTAFLIGEGFDPATLKAREWALHLFFPFGVIFGLILGWQRQFLGGLIAVIGLTGFYLLHFAVSGGFPRGWAFAVLAAPGLLFLLSAGINKRACRPPLQPSNPSTL